MKYSRRDAFNVCKTWFLSLCIFSASEAKTQISISTVTSDNGLPARSIIWKDSANLQRSVVLVDQRSNGGGYLRQFVYKVSGVDRICRGTGANGHQGDGYVQNHTIYGGDNSSHGTGGTTSIPLNGTHHAIVDFYMPGYTINSPGGSGGTNATVPTRIQWFFATGRNYPIFSIVQDARASAGNIGADCRTPYGDMHYDGTVNYASPYTGDLIGGASWGDTHKWVSLTNGTTNESTQVTTGSGWRYDQPNTIPYAMQWTKTRNAEMGRVLTQPISVKDMGLRSAPNLGNIQQLNGPMISDGQWAYQILNYGMINAGGGVTKRLTWGTNWGYPGGFNEWGSYTSKTDFTRHSDGVRTSGMLLAYSVWDVFGLHNGSYTNGATGSMVKQMENLQLATLTAIIGSVKTSGPAGVGLADNAQNNVTYIPTGYNHVFATWDVNAAANAADITLTPTTNAPIETPVFVIGNYTGPASPAIYINGNAAAANTDYFLSADVANTKLWITLNRTITAATHLQVNSTVLPLNFIRFTVSDVGTSNILQWETAQEVNTAHFDIEASNDGINFHVLTKEKAKGNTNNQYQFEDRNPGTKTWYRLKQLDADGRFTFSNTILLTKTVAQTVRIHPNPATDKITLSGLQPGGNITIYSLSGKKIETLSSQTTTIDLPVNHLAAGIYLLEYQQGHKTVRQKFVKQ